MLLEAVTSEGFSSLQLSAFRSVFVSLKNAVTFLIKHHSQNIITMNQCTRKQIDIRFLSLLHCAARRWTEAL